MAPRVPRARRGHAEGAEGASVISDLISDPEGASGFPDHGFQADFVQRQRGQPKSVDFCTHIRKGSGEPTLSHGRAYAPIFRRLPTTGLNRASSSGSEPAKGAQTPAFSRDARATALIDIILLNGLDETAKPRTKVTENYPHSAGGGPQGSTSPFYWTLDSYALGHGTRIRHAGPATNVDSCLV